MGRLSSAREYVRDAALLFLLWVILVVVAPFLILLHPLVIRVARKILSDQESPIGTFVRFLHHGDPERFPDGTIARPSEW